MSFTGSTLSFLLCSHRTAIIRMPSHDENLEPANSRDLNFGSRHWVQARLRCGREEPVQMHHCDGDRTQIAKFGCAGLTKSAIKQEAEVGLRMGGEAHKTYEVRCPVYGFVGVNDWEWQIISQPAYQRLRRIVSLPGPTMSSPVHAYSL